MSALLPALIGAISGALVAGIGWFVTHTLAIKREELARRDNTARSTLKAKSRNSGLQDFFVHEAQFEVLHRLGRESG
jgi:hypothetical protein